MSQIKADLKAIIMAEKAKRPITWGKLAKLLNDRFGDSYTGDQIKVAVSRGCYESELFFKLCIIFGKKRLNFPENWLQ